MTQSLLQHARSPLQRAALQIVGAGLLAVEPSAATQAALAQTDLHCASPGSVVVVALGKAAHAMAHAARTALGPALREGLVVAPSMTPPTDVQTRIGTSAARAASPLPQTALRTIVGEHPIPGHGSAKAGEQIAALLQRCGPADTVLVLISGGGSALACLPDVGLTISDVAATTAAVLRAGVPITAINAVRKRIDRLKGGGMARLAAPARVISLVLSDVIGDTIDTVASGPTAVDTSHDRDAEAALAACTDPIPTAVRQRIARPTTPSSPSATAVVEHHRVAGNRTAVDAAQRWATAQGWRVERDAPLLCDARDGGLTLGQRIAGWATGAPRCVVLGGEPTVRVTGNGLGGRNQQLALAAAHALHGSHDRVLVAFATDGRDGPTDAAGAIVDGSTIAAAHAAGHDPVVSLAHHNAYPCLDAAGALLRTGLTGTNVCDLVVGVWRDSKR